MTLVERYGTALRLYDNGGASMDRYTIIPPRWAHQYRQNANGNTRGDSRLFMACASSVDPYAACGVGLTTEAMPGQHLGKRIHWKLLPQQVQQFAREVFPEFCPEQASRQSSLELAVPSPACNPITPPLNHHPGIIPIYF